MINSIMESGVRSQESGVRSQESGVRTKGRGRFVRIRDIFGIEKNY